MKYEHPESSVLEFKSTLPKNDQIIKTVIGFCNRHGGKIIVGVTDDGEMAGVPEDSLEETLESIESAILHACEPPILVRTSVQRPSSDIALLCVEVGAGMTKPYYRKSEGKTKGTYIRIGRSTIRATPELIQELEWSSRGINYEATPLRESSVDELDSSKLEHFFASRRARSVLTPTAEVLQSYQITMMEQLDTYPTVCGALLFGKVPGRYLPEAMIICSHFRGNAGRDVVSTVDCEGSLFEQFDNAYTFLLSRLGKEYRWEGPRRIDTLEVPEEAIREGILNAIVHRNYHINSPTKIALYDDRIEIFSPGAFAGPLISADLPNGMSYLRNPALCRIFREAGLMEKLGSGLSAIFETTATRGLKRPEIVDGGEFIKLIIYRIHDSTNSLTDDDNKILALFGEQERVRVATVQEALETSRATAGRRLDSLVERGLLLRKGNTRSLHYVKNDAKKQTSI